MKFSKFRNQFQFLNFWWFCTSNCAHFLNTILWMLDFSLEFLDLLDHNLSSERNLSSYHLGIAKYSMVLLKLIKCCLKPPKQPKKWATFIESLCISTELIRNETDKSFILPIIHYVFISTIFKAIAPNRFDLLFFSNFICQRKKKMKMAKFKRYLL